MVFLRALGGGESVCRLPEPGSPACRDGVRIVCSGTALSSFACRYKDFPQGLCA